MEKPSKQVKPEDVMDRAPEAKEDVVDVVRPYGFAPRPSMGKSRLDRKPTYPLNGRGARTPQPRPRYWSEEDAGG